MMNLQILLLLDTKRRTAFFRWNIVKLFLQVSSQFRCIWANISSYTHTKKNSNKAVEFILAELWGQFK